LMGELSLMNHSRIGEPYTYPDSFIQLLGYMRAYFHLPFRQTQGVVIAHANNRVHAYQIIVLLVDV